MYLLWMMLFIANTSLFMWNLWYRDGIQWCVIMLHYCFAWCKWPGKLVAEVLFIASLFIYLSFCCVIFMLYESCGVIYSVMLSQAININIIESFKSVKYVEEKFKLTVRRTNCMRYLNKISPQTVREIESFNIKFH